MSFSGCTPKYLKCQTPKPERTFHKVCGGIESDFEFAQCASSKYITLDGDYEVLSKAFDSCK